MKIFSLLLVVLLTLTSCEQVREVESKEQGTNGEVITATAYGEKSGHPVTAKVLSARKIGATGNVNKAISLLEEIVNENPEFAYAQYTLGYFYLKAKRFEDAVKPNEEAVRLDGDKAFHRSGYARALLRVGKFEQALAEVRASNELCKEGRDKSCNEQVVFQNYLMKAETLKRLGDKESAIEAVETALKMKPEDLMALKVKAFVLE